MHGVFVESLAKPLRSRPAGGNYPEYVSVPVEPERCAARVAIRDVAARILVETERYFVATNLASVLRVRDNSVSIRTPRPDPVGQTEIASMENDYALRSVEVALTPSARFEEYLQSRGMRNTEQRRILVEHVFNHHEHFDADTLIEQLPRKGQPGYVSRPTVYRTLNEFVDAGLLRKFELEGRAVFEHDYGYPAHDHLHCQQCQRLIEFHSDDLVRLRDQVARDHHFRVDAHRLIITGICLECSRARQRTRRRQDQI